MDNGDRDMLILRALDGTATPAEESAVEWLLREDPAARRAMILHSAQEALMRDVLREPSFASRAPKFPRIALFATAAALLVAVGLVLVLTRDSSDDLRVISGDAVIRNDTISTGPDADGVVRLADRATVRLGAASELTVTERRERRVAAVRLSKGNAWFDVEQEEGELFTVATPPATIEVKGTRFRVRLSNRRLSVVVEKGVVDVVNILGRRSAGPEERIVVDEDGAPDVMPAGRIAFVSDRDGNREIYTMESDCGDLRRLTEHPGDDADPAWSPDGATIAFASEREGKRSIFLMNADGTGVRRLTDGGGEDRSPAWSPDGTRIAFVSDRDGNREIYIMNADGADRRNISHCPDEDFSPAWLPDGGGILFVSTRFIGRKMEMTANNACIYRMDPDGGNVRLVNTQATALPEGVRGAPQAHHVTGAKYREFLHPSVSADGKWLAFATILLSDGAIRASEKGQSQGVSIVEFGTSNVRRLTKKDDAFPQWSANGKWMLFESLRDGNSEIYLTNVENGAVRRLTANGAFDGSAVWAPPNAAH